jgi:rhodanese-related sulfurtransferase
MKQAFEFFGNHPLLAGAFMLLLVLFIRNEMKRGGRTVTAQELVTLVNHEGAVVLDVRDKKDFQEGHIVDAVSIPHSALKGRVRELDAFKNRPLVVTCKMGQHAGTAGMMLRKAGFENVVRLRGGIMEWRNQNLPVVKG